MAQCCSGQISSKRRKEAHRRGVLEWYESSMGITSCVLHFAFLMSKSDLSETTDEGTLGLSEFGHEGVP